MQETRLLKTIRLFFLLCAFLLATGCAEHRDTAANHVDLSPDLVVELQVEEADLECSYFYFLWGRYAELTAQLNEALEAYEKALICDPETDYIAQKIPILLLRLDRVDEAKEHLQAYLLKHPQESGVRMLLAKILIRQKSYDAAIEQYQIVHRQHPEEVRALLLLSELHLARQQFDAAREVLQQVVAISEDAYPAHVLLAALQHYRKALAINWSSELELEIGELYLQNKEYAKAEEVYRQIIDRESDNEEAAIALVHAYLLQEKEDDALTTLNRLKITSENPERVELTIAKIYARRQQYSKAADILRGILLRENLSQARYLLAIIEFQLKEYEEALLQLQQIPRNAEDYEKSVFLQVRLLRVLERPDEAINILEEALNDREVSNVDMYVLLATLYQMQGKESLSEATFNRALSIYPDNDNLLYEFGLFLDQTGEQQRAMSVMQKLITRQPEHAAALNYIGYTWADRKEHLDKALEYIKRAVTLKPENGYIRDSLGWVYYRLGDLEQAERELEEAIRLSPDDPAIYDHLGDVYLESGQLQKALQTYRKALELSIEEPDKARIQEKIRIVEEQESK